MVLQPSRIGVTRRRAQGPVQAQDDLGVRQGPVGEVPAAVGQLGAHLEAPLREDVVGREVVLDELVAPGRHAGDVFADELQVLAQREVEGFLLAGARTAAHAARLVDLHQGRGTHPDAGTHADALHVGGESGHVREALRDRPPSTAHRGRPSPGVQPASITQNGRLRCPEASSARKVASRRMASASKLRP